MTGSIQKSQTREPRHHVLKFGGTSVQDATAIRNLVSIVSSRRAAIEIKPTLVVVSALSKVTDELLKISKLCQEGQSTEVGSAIQRLLQRHLDVGTNLGLGEAELSPLRALFDEVLQISKALSSLRELTARSQDRLVSTGELASSRLVVGAFLKAGFPTLWIDARQLVCTDSNFGSAAVDLQKTEERVQELLVPQLVNHWGVTQGFIGSDPKGLTTTLGRGGSDYSAALFGASLHGERVEIWTDVDGILTTDPRVVPEARLIDRIHASEAAEMAYLGAKVLHPNTLFPALAEKIPVWILNSKNPTCTGTEITFDESSPTIGVRGIAFKRDVILVNIHSLRMMGAPGFLKTVFDVFARHQISVDLISTSEVNLSLTLDPNANNQSLKEARESLEQFATVDILDGQSLIAVVGTGLRHTAGLAGRIFLSLEDINVRMISMGASELNVSFVVESSQANRAVQKLHRALIEEIK